MGFLFRIYTRILGFGAVTWWIKRSFEEENSYEIGAISRKSGY